jgi:phosphotransferase system HPr-like phosphotransfer protein
MARVQQWRTCNLRCPGKSNSMALAALSAFFKEFGDEQ